MQVYKKDEKSLTERWAEKTLTRHPQPSLCSKSFVS